MSYIEDLEKRIEELEPLAEISCQLKKEAFLFRRLEKLILAHYESHGREINDTLNTIKSSDTDTIRKTKREKRIKISGQRSEAWFLKIDIESTKKDMEKYSEEELLHPDFFNF